VKGEITRGDAISREVEARGRGERERRKSGREERKRRELGRERGGS